ncbi:hypothetical protein PLUTE_b1097 [Pseudoalteromonas luteoviolacea DSM 6061]|nr:hypothetical protein [Pseudoalteromonas luteoviolacea DSM 6061]
MSSKAAIGITNIVKLSNPASRALKFVASNEMASIKLMDCFNPCCA